jgi:hypothetical protein
MAGLVTASWVYPTYGSIYAEAGQARLPMPSTPYSRLSKDVDARDIGVRKHAVLWTAMRGHNDCESAIKLQNIKPGIIVGRVNQPFGIHEHIG